MGLTSGHVDDHISYFDNQLLGLAGFGTTYVVCGDEIAIVETGTSLCAPTVYAGLEHLSIDPSEVRHIVLTHVHMDHAGGAGTIIKAMPEAQVYLHSTTIQHLIDPSKLLASAARALGGLFAAHGTVEPLAPERIQPADTLRLDLGRDVVLQAIPTPGHASDHISYLDVGSGTLVVGDAVGIILPDYEFLGPVTPPPAIDVVAQQHTFDHLLELPIKRLLFTHFGPTEITPRTAIMQLRERYNQFADLVQAGVATDQVDKAQIMRTMLANTNLPGRAVWALEGWIEMSIRGMTRYYTKRKEQGLV